ncbi:glycosyltransferase family 4 protein [Halopseudomonas sp.]|uniref:glycosyltransferase family 4 protein n=1 Tax=Halopseudomonas sp. TaxID=2901191 RepID=UPI00353030DA
MKRICHLSSAHKGLDVRIFYKECVTLSKEGYDTNLVISATLDDVEVASRYGVKVHPLPFKGRSRVKRMFFHTLNCYRLARKIDADIYHIHDPELIPVACVLSALGKAVIYDVHEDLPLDVLSKGWIPRFLRGFIASASKSLEWLASKYFVDVVAATPAILNRFKLYNHNAVNVNNYPLLSEFCGPGLTWADKLSQVCYVGGIGESRGAMQVVKAMEIAESGAVLKLAGNFSDPIIEAEVRKLSGWALVDYLGWLGRSEVSSVLQSSFAGLVTLHPLPNYIDSLPVKMFEYMGAGIPVIASDFPLWKEIIEDNECGLCVNPLDPMSISKAIDFLYSNPADAERMGLNGYNLILSKYNWSVEGRKLVLFYRGIESRMRTA